MWDLQHTYPNATADAMARPRAADLPRPLAAVRVTVLRRVFSEMASTNFSTAFACGTHSNHHTLLNEGFLILHVSEPFALRARGHYAIC